MLHPTQVKTRSGQVSTRSDLPGFFFFLVVFVGVLVFLVGIAVFVKVFIVKDFVVFVVARLAPSMLRGHDYSVATVLPAGAAAAAGVFGAGGAAGAPGSVEYVVQ